MTDTINDDEITYGPSKVNLKSMMSTLAFLAAGAAIILWGMHDYSQGGVLAYKAGGLAISGVILVLGVIAGAIFRFNGTLNNTPHVTMTSYGISYTLSPKFSYEASWDSVGPFKSIPDGVGGIKKLEAPITCQNLSDNIKKDEVFSISLLKLLDVEPLTLLDEINQVRVNALAMRKDVSI